MLLEEAEVRFACMSRMSKARTPHLKLNAQSAQTNHLKDGAPWMRFELGRGVMRAGGDALARICVARKCGCTLASG